MLKNRPLLVTLLALLMLPLTSANPVSGRAEPVREAPLDFRTGALLVKFKPGVGAEERAVLLGRVEGREELVQRGTGVRRVAVPQGRETVTLAELRRQSQVAYAELDHVASLQWTPNDPQYGNGTQWGLERTSANMAWDRARGDGILVAVIDTGVDLSHPDLAANVAPGYNFVNNTNAAADDNGHGTHVAGIIAALGNNGTGGLGVAPNARIMPLKALAADGVGYYSDIAAAIQYAADHGAQVINMSLGGTAYSQSLRDAVDYAWNRGVVLVAAAGNASSSAPTYPAAFPNVMAVAATNSSDVKASFSNYGSYISVAAPGVSIYSTVPGGYGWKSGTSMAAPFVAGTAALVLSGSCEGQSSAEVRRTVESGADSIDAINVGYSGQLGHGRVDAAQALPVLPAITTSEDNLRFLAQAGDDRAQDRTIVIGTGGCGLRWNASVTTSGPPSDWISTSNSNTTDTLTVSVNPAGMSPGSYLASIAVRYAGHEGGTRIGLQLVVAGELSRVTVTPVGKGGD